MSLTIAAEIKKCSENPAIPCWAHRTAKLVVGEEELVSADQGFCHHFQLEWVLATCSVKVLS